MRIHAVLGGAAVAAALAATFDTLQPLVLQGAVAGACLVLPLGLVATAVTSGLRTAARTFVPETIRQGSALLTTVAVVISTLPMSSPGRRSAPASTSRASGQAARPRAAQAVASLEHSLAVLEDGLREAPRDRWDPDAVVAQVGTDPGQLLEWVRQNTVWIPYHGILRGAVGVLNDRMGNSADRAVLLAALLQGAGHEVRLARRQLPAEDATRMAAWSILAPTPAAESDGGRAATPALGGLAAQYGLEPKVVTRTLEARGRVLDDLIAEIEMRVADQSARLLGTIDRSRVGAEWRQRIEAASAAAADHWWVQWRGGDGWADLDLLDRDAGAPVPLETRALDQLSDLQHRLTIAVVGEQWRANGPTEHTVLTHAVFPSELKGRSLLLQFWPTDWPVPAETAATAPSITELALRQRTWDVGLVVGDAIAAEGTLTEIGPASEAGGSFGAFGGALMGALTGRQPASDPLTAVWVEFEIRAPAMPARKIRRQVFDLVGPSARAARRPFTLTSDLQLTRALSLMTRSEILPVNFAFSREFVADLAGRRLLADKSLLLAAARGDVTGDPALVEQWMTDGTPPATPLYALAVARLEWSRHREQILIDRINVLARHRFFTMSGRELVVRDATDIVANEVGVEVATVDALEVRLEQGVLDTNVERMLQAGGNAAANTAEAFAASADWQVAGRTLEGFHLPPDVLRRMSDDLARGMVVIAPRRAVQIGAHPYAGWWRIDPATGDTLGLAANGWGQAMGERAVKYNVIAVAARQFVFDYALCQAIPIIANAARPLVIELFGAPSWASVPQQKSTSEMYQENFRGCMIAAIASGAVFATLPLLLATLRYTIRGLGVLPRLSGLARPGLAGPRWGPRSPGRPPRPPRPPRPGPEGPSNTPGGKPPCG